MTFLYQKSRCLIEAFSLHLKHLLLFLPTTMYEGSRMVIYNRLRRDIIEILKVLIQRKPDVRTIEGEACPDHIHMLLEIPPKYSVAEIMGYLKSKSTLMIFDRHANLKYKYGNRHFWARGYD